jgi:glycosyltransferase involved in cell wall biosynthesis
MCARPIVCTSMRTSASTWGCLSVRVLMATSSLRRREAGASAVMMELGRHLEKYGHEVEVLYGDDVPRGPIFPVRFEELYFSLGVARHVFRNPGRYDVVNLRAPTGFFYGIARRLRKRPQDPPYVAELDGLEERRVFILRQQGRKNQAWDNSLKNRLWHRFYHLPRFRIAVRTADWVVCATREIWNYVQLAYGLSSDRVTYMPHAVDSRFVRKREYPPIATSSGPKLLYVGTWLPQRGIRYIAEAMPALREKFPGIRLTIAGCLQGSDAILPGFPAQVRDCISVVPFVPSEEMPEVYANHDIFLFPSFFEALPLVLLEAMAGGMPVITAETSGMVDAVRDGWNGLLIPPGDSQAIVGAVVLLTESADMRGNLGRAAQETAGWFNWARIAGVLDGVFRQLVPGK